MNRAEYPVALRRHKIVVVLRGLTGDRFVPAAQALYTGGVRMLEVTFDQKNPAALTDTAAAIAAIRAALPGDLLVGAGTVLTTDQVRAAARAGAGYILSPTLDVEVVRAAWDEDMAAIPGALTPSEIVGAWQAGAAAVKLFPAGNFGLDYIKAVSVPLSHIPLMPMGGVDANNAADFLSLPTVAGVGVGSAIANLSLIRAGDWEGLTDLTRAFIDRLSNNTPRD